MENYRKKVSRTIVYDSGNRRILLNRRPEWSRQGAGQLQIIGGKFSADDETRKHAAVREINEELALAAEVRDVLFLCTSENNGWMTFAFILLLEKVYDIDSMPDHGEYDELVFVDVDTLQQKIEAGEIAFDHPQILQTFLQVISGTAT